MKETVTKYYCDICKKEFRENELRRVELPFITNCDWTEGRGCSDRVYFEKVDICVECLHKSTNLHCGFQGMNKRIEK